MTYQACLSTLCSFHDSVRVYVAINGYQYALPLPCCALQRSTAEFRMYWGTSELLWEQVSSAKNLECSLELVVVMGFSWYSNCQKKCVWARSCCKQLPGLLAPSTGSGSQLRAGMLAEILPFSCCGLTTLSLEWPMRARAPIGLQFWCGTFCGRYLVRFWLFDICFWLCGYLLKFYCKRLVLVNASRQDANNIEIEMCLPNRATVTIKIWCCCFLLTARQQVLLYSLFLKKLDWRYCGWGYCVYWTSPKCQLFCPWRNFQWTNFLCRSISVTASE